MGFLGYVRPDGAVGLRNHVAVMSSVSCANGVVNAIARAVPAVKAITHTEGCGRGLADITLSSRTLIGLGKNPNVAGLLVVGLGCEFIKAPEVAAAVRRTGKRAEALLIQEEGGSRKTTAKGIEIARQLLAEAEKEKREDCGWERLVVGLECGGSDALSGFTANQLVGSVSDELVAWGATVLLGEVTEMIGAEKILARRAATPELSEKILDLVHRQKKQTEELLGPLAGFVISPGNMEGGLSNITEKSLGCINKAGSSAINDLIEYAATPRQRGLVIMDTPGSDIFQLTGMVAGGAQLVLFTTGRGTPAGFPLAPVIKISSNSDTFLKMQDDIDLNAGRLLEGETMADMTRELLELIRRVMEGEPTKAEINLQEVVALHTLAPAF